MTSDHGIEVH